MKRKIIGRFLAVILAAGTILSGCDISGLPELQAALETTMEATAAIPEEGRSDTAQAASPRAEEESASSRPGAKWIDSGLYGTFEGMGEIRAQDDFAAYVNREWAENVRINDGESNVSARTEQTDVINKAKLELLGGEKRADKELTSLQNLYQLLLDWDKRNTDGFDELKTCAADIMGITSISGMTELLSDPERNLYATPMVTEMFNTDPDDAFTNILYIMSPAIYGGEPADYEKTEEETPSVAINRQIGEYMLKRLGYSDTEAKELFDQCLDFERGFVPGMEAEEKRMMELGPVAMFTTMFTVEEMESRYPNFPICDIYKAWGIDLTGHKLGVIMPEVLKTLDQQYTDEYLEGLKAWVLLHTVTEYTDYLDREAYEKAAEFNAVLTGIDSLPEDEVYALKTINKLVPAMVDEAYVNYCFDKDIKPQVAELTDMMIDAYREMLREEDWLSETTKAAAIDKLDNIKLNICYPENLPEVEPAAISSAEEGGTLFEAIKASKIYGRRMAADLIQRRNDGTYWRYDNYYSTLGACYVAGENSINIFAGICGGDYYDPDWPLEKKLGGLCMVVGHEITHAFDDSGSTFDKDGNYKNWWTDEDRAEFQKRVDKLNRYYSALVPIPQISEEPYGEDSAQNLDGEAIGDLGSMKCLLSIAGKQETFDYDMFFTQIATIQKNQRYEPAELYYLATENHPVECYRCNIPVQNYDEFLETYDVKEGDGMYLAPEDRITVW